MAFKSTTGCFSGAEENTCIKQINLGLQNGHKPALQRATLRGTSGNGGLSLGPAAERPPAAMQTSLRALHRCCRACPAPRFSGPGKNIGRSIFGPPAFRFKHVTNCEEECQAYNVWFKSVANLVFVLQNVRCVENSGEAHSLLLASLVLSQLFQEPCCSL